MTSKQFLLPIAKELVVDLFAGGGGWSVAFEQATGQEQLKLKRWPNEKKQSSGYAKATTTKTQKSTFSFSK